MPTRIKPKFWVSDKVVKMARAIPRMPNTFPWRAVTGELNPFKDRMKKIDATRYASATLFADTLYSLKP
jgi:hypothetical protein